MVLQITIALIAISLLQFVVTVQALHRLLGDVDSTRYTAAFHVIRQRDIIRPHIELPFDQTENAAMNTSSVNADAHIDIDGHHFADESARD